MTVLFVTAALLVRDPVALALLLAMTAVMVAIGVCDLEQGRIPNAFIVVLAALALAWRWNGDGNLITALVEGAVVFAVGILLNAGFRAITGKAGLGMGDTKLMTAGALALPPGALLLFLFAGGVFGVLFGLAGQQPKATRQFPFAPALLAALWISLARADAILRWLEAKYF